VAALDDALGDAALAATRIWLVIGSAVEPSERQALVRAVDAAYGQRTSLSFGTLRLDLWEPDPAGG
jgi:hypothetical protein